MKKTQKKYRYILTLNEAIWPRRLADELCMLPYFQKNLISVTDLQRKDHVYGDTYTVQE